MTEEQAQRLCAAALRTAAQHRARLKNMFGTDCGYPKEICRRYNPQTASTCLLCAGDNEALTLHGDRSTNINEGAC